MLQRKNLYLFLVLFLIPFSLIGNQLFEAYPELQKNLCHVPLGDFPTPILKLEKLGKNLGVENLYLKHDGLSGKPFGGNKVRKLEFLLADAIHKGAEAVMTVGCAGSNHALATVTCAHKLGLRAIQMLTPQRNTKYLQRNLLMSLFFGGEIHYYDSVEKRDEGMLSIYEQEEQQTGDFPYFIPGGGSNPLGATGFVNAAFELKKQIQQGILPEPDVIYTTLGSAGTASGLILGLKLAGIKSKVITVGICGTVESRTNLLIDLYNKTNSFLNTLEPLIPIIDFPQEDVSIYHDFVGEGYAAIPPETEKAIKLLYSQEGIKLDGTYTGKTFTALIHDIMHKDGLKDKVILFWDTFCPGAFSETTDKVDYKQLPSGLHHYFEEGCQASDCGV